MRMSIKQRGSIKIIVITIFIVAIFLISGIIAYILQHRNDSYKPVINPNPKQFITISGKIDPRISGKIIATYQNSNRKCFVTTNWLEVGPEPRTKEFTYPIKTNNKYSLKLPVDEILKGKCGWKFEDFDFKANFHDLSNRNLLFYFKNKASKRNKEFRATSICRTSTYENKKYFECKIRRNYDMWIPKNTKKIHLNVLLAKGS